MIGIGGDSFFGGMVAGLFVGAVAVVLLLRSRREDSRDVTVQVNNYTGDIPVFEDIDSDDDDRDGGDDPPATPPPGEPHGAEVPMSFEQMMGRLWNPAVMGN